MKRSWIKRSKSPRKKIIDKVKTLMRQILKLRDGDRCFFCGKPGSHFKYPLSLFHILSVGSYPRLECEIENTVLACWGDFPFKCCHNLWEDRVEPHKSWMEEKLLVIKGANYKDALKIQNKILPPLNAVRAEWYLEYYKQELERLQKGKYEEPKGNFRRIL